ncbi:MAG: transcriptional regulator [Blastopirellula sp.]|nr:MAG: transcriptional regulator [Blastopirellula sp.]
MDCRMSLLDQAKKRRGKIEDKDQEEEMTTKYKLTGKSKDSYMNCLVKFMPLISIKDINHLAYASEVIDELISQDRSEGEDEYLKALTDLIEAYEDKNVEVQESSVCEMLSHLIHSRGTTQAAIAKEAGISRSTLSEILSGKDKVSKKIALKLAEYFGVSVALFLKN